MQDKAAAAGKWCEEMGAESLADLEGFEEAFVQAVGADLKPIPRKRLLDRVTAAAKVGALVARERLWPALSMTQSPRRAQPPHWHPRWHPHGNHAGTTLATTFGNHAPLRSMDMPMDMYINMNMRICVYMDMYMYRCRIDIDMRYEVTRPHRTRRPAHCQDLAHLLAHRPNDPALGIPRRRSSSALVATHTHRCATRPMTRTISTRRCSA